MCENKIIFGILVHVLVKMVNMINMIYRWRKTALGLHPGI